MQEFFNNEKIHGLQILLEPQTEFVFDIKNMKEWLETLSLQILEHKQEPNSVFDALHSALKEQGVSQKGVMSLKEALISNISNSKSSTKVIKIFKTLKIHLNKKNQYIESFLLLLGVA
jgi:hypothetical protein